MTFFPKNGYWSEESFSDTSGATITNPADQTIKGGYVTLIGSNDNFTFYNAVWSAESDFVVFNSLKSSIINDDFTQIHAQEYNALPVSVTGYQQSFTVGGAWEIFTPYPISGDKGVFTEALYATDIADPFYWVNYFNDSGLTATLEIDVCSLYDPYSGLNTLQGFITGTQNDLTLSALTGVLCHGIYLKTPAAFEFIEVLPYGLRLRNHPEIAIPIDLTTPKRIRIAVDNSDIYLSTEDGRTVVGRGLFSDATVDGESALVFGAPPLSGTAYGNMANVTGFAGHTLWANYRLKTDSLSLEDAPDGSQYFSTAANTLYTAPFDPGRGISRYVSAVVGFLPYAGGTTIITAQYSGTTGYVDSSATLTINANSSSPDSIDLSSIPIYSYPRSNLSTNLVYNPIRFKIVQYSTSGRSPAPAVDYIRVNADSTRSYLDLFPNWRPVTYPTYIDISIVTGDHLTKEPEPTLWTDALINIPTTVGVLSSDLPDDSKNNVVFDIVGTGVIEQGGRFGFMYTNYVYTSGTAQSSSQAATYLGTSPVENFFPNPLLTEEFVPVEGIQGYITGKTFGEISPHLDLPTNFTGNTNVYFEKSSVIRPELQARENRLLGLIGSQNLDVNYLQTVTVPAYSSSVNHDGTAGIEIVIPSGIINGNMLAELDLQIAQGDSLYVYTSGAVTSRNWTLTGKDYRIFREVGFPLTATSSGEARLGLVVLSGASSNSEYKFSLDNISVSPIRTSYIVGTGITCDIHRTGTIFDGHAFTEYSNVSRASTVFNTDLILHTYPETNGILVECTGSGSKGFGIYLTNNGYLSGFFDRETDAMAPSVGATGTKTSLSRNSFVTDIKIPIGQLSNVGFIHQSINYNKLASATHSGALIPENFAACNRVYLTLNGQPIYSADAAADWWHNFVLDGSSLDSTPLTSYIPLSGSVKLTAMSGLHCSFDGLRLDRPPIADAEIELSINGARATAPYFLPDKLMNGSIENDNQLLLSLYNGSSPVFGKQTFLGSIYNFTNPGFTNWDHGPWKNHLVFYGNVSKSSLSPYSGLGSTHFGLGDYAVAKYSSAADRFGNNQTDNALISFLNFDGLNQGIFEFKTWAYPTTTGYFFHILNDQRNLTGSRYSFGLNSSSNVILTRFSGSTELFTHTGSSIELSSWNYLGFRAQIGNTGASVVSTSLIINDTLTDVIIRTGAGYPMKYKGNNGDSLTGSVIFGYNADVYLCDSAFSPISATPPTYDSSWTTGNKGGYFQQLIEDYTPYTGTVTWDSFTHGTMTLTPESVPQERYFWVAGFYSSINLPKYNGGINLYDDRLFKDTPAYSISYDSSRLVQKFGDIDSPIKLGNIVPAKAINIAKVDIQSFDVLSSVNTIDLSSSNFNNYTSYKDGEYFIKRGVGTVSGSTALTINSNNPNTMSGRADVTFVDEVSSNNIDISTVSIVDKNLETPTNAYYCYLLGRGTNVLYAPNTLPHYTGTVTAFTTGTIADNYIANLNVIKSSITIRNSAGTRLDINEYPFDIYISPYNVNSYRNAIDDSVDINLAGFNITGDVSDYLLDDHYFSVILLTNKKTVSDNDSIWAHYTSYNTSTEQLNTNHKEIINPIPIFRQNQIYESPKVGRYSVTRNSDQSSYVIKIYGIESGISGSI